MRIVLFYTAITLLPLFTACNNDATVATGTGTTDSIAEKEPVIPRFATYREAIEAMRAKKDESMLMHNIIEPDKAAAFKGLQYFAPDSTYIFKAKLTLLKPEKVSFKTTDERTPVYYKFCKISFSKADTATELFGYVNEDEIQQPTSLFIPFKDKTSGLLAYGGGRYIDLDYHGEKNMILLDFNYAYNPYCHYNHNYSCPLVPAENILKISILAGEKKLYE